jgi:hypothetical protein
MPDYYSRNLGRVSSKNNFNFSGNNLIQDIDNLFATEVFRYGIIKASDNLWRNVIHPDELKINELVLPGYSSYNSLESFVSALSKEVSGYSCEIAQEYSDEAAQLNIARPVFGMVKPVAIWGIDSDRLTEEYAHWLDQSNTAKAAIFFAVSEKPVMYNAANVCENLHDAGHSVNKPLAELLGKLAPFYVYDQVWEIERAASNAALEHEKIDKEEIKAKFRGWSDKYVYSKVSKPLLVAAFNAALNSKYEQEIEALIYSKPFAKSYSEVARYRSSASFVLNNDSKYQYKTEVLIACREVLPATVKLTRRKLPSQSTKLTKVDMLKFMYAIVADLPIAIRKKDISHMYVELRRALRLYEAFHGTFSYRLTQAYKQLAQTFEASFERSFKHWATPGDTSKHKVLQWLLYERDSKAYKQAVKNAKVTQRVKPVNINDTFKHYTSVRLKTNIEAYLRDYLAAYKQSNAKNQNKKTKAKNRKVSKVPNQAAPGSSSTDNSSSRQIQSGSVGTTAGC